MKELTDEQIDILFYGLAAVPTEDSLRSHLSETRENEERAESLPSDLMHDMGYSKDEIERIKRDL